MDYARIYRDFIADRLAKKSGLTGYVERHHIVPRALSGTDEESNLVALSAEDHFFAHLLLAKIHGGSMWGALQMMTVGRDGCGHAYLRRMRKHVAAARERAGKEHSKRMRGYFAGDKHPMYGRRCPPVALAKLKERLAAGFNPMASDQAKAKVGAFQKYRFRSESEREKIAASRRGKKLSDETCAAISRGHIGLEKTAATRAKLSAAQKGRPKSAASVEKMRRSLIGRKLSADHVAKLLPHLASLSRFRGMSHSEGTKKRMSEVNQAKKLYAHRFKVSARGVSLSMMREAGISI